MKSADQIWAKSPKNGGIPLSQHLKDTARFAVMIARHLNMDEHIAYHGAILHDIGKAATKFQKSLAEGYVRQPGKVFRHEIASLFFLSLFPEDEQDRLIDMIVAHHKSIYNDAGHKGILDMWDNEPNCLNNHIEDFETWSMDALNILKEIGLNIHPIDRRQAEASLYKAIDYCESRTYGYSVWKGILIAADHLASALEPGRTDAVATRLFIQPALDFYSGRSKELYPLSLLSTDDKRKHTLVTAPTGAGKTDFLIRRCKGRIFYTLPFQASINAMFERIKDDLKNTNADIRLLHAASSLRVEQDGIEETVLQRHIGASIKVLTPHQLASLVFATKGYEAQLVDVMGCDVILDEIHTYSDMIQSIVLKIVEILVSTGCRIHIGTATMPSALYNELLKLLGGRENVYEVLLNDKTLDSFDRHTVHKNNNFEELLPIIGEAVKNKQKVLLVANRVKQAQQWFESLDELYSDTPKMLIHSRFRRVDRNNLERQLQNTFNTSADACIVVSTQVVEVSLDISFDLMITECAPIDSLIQRFGRINRKRTELTIGNFKPVYIIAPPDAKTDALPYSLDVLQRTFEVLPDGQVLHERNIQELIDKVYPEISFMNIDLSAVFVNGKWLLKELWHNPKSALLEALDIDSIACIDENDRELYEHSSFIQQSMLEIPVSYRSIGYRKLDQSTAGTKPFVIPHTAYDTMKGLLIVNAMPENYDSSFRFL